jgi:hypothetical protein
MGGVRRTLPVMPMPQWGMQKKGRVEGVSVNLRVNEAPSPSVWLQTVLAKQGEPLVVVWVKELLLIH